MRKSDAFKFTVTMLSLNKLKPYKLSAKIHLKQDINKIADSIQQYGFRQPIVTDSDYVIICGHGRYYAAKQLNLRTVPVHIATNLSSSAVREYRILDNKLNELSDWSRDALTAELLQIAADTNKSKRITTQSFGFDFDKLDLNTTQIKPRENKNEVTYEICIKCKNLAEQERIYNMLTGKGIVCRLSKY